MWSKGGDPVQYRNGIISILFFFTMKKKSPFFVLTVGSRTLFFAMLKPLTIPVNLPLVNVQKCHRLNLLLRDMSELQR